HDQRLRVEVDQCRLVDVAEELDSRVARRHLPKTSLVLARARDLEGDVRAHALERLDEQVDALPPVEPPGHEDIATGPRLAESVEGRRVMQRLEGHLLP